jgi:pimeloyl-ACP methyl ester carboxylesterase
MSGYTAVRLTGLHHVRSLVLLVPAMYTPEAYEAQFNGGFSRIIRSHRSWERSDAWAILGEFRGNLLVVAAEHDTVIPFEVVERTVQSASRARSRRLHVVPRAKHLGLFRSETEFGKVVGLIRSLVAESAGCGKRASG